MTGLPVAGRRGGDIAVGPDSALLDVGAVVVTSLLLLLSGFGVTGWARTVLALGFVTFVPGWAVLGHVRMATGPTRLALAVAMSFTVCGAGALAMAWLGQWRPYLLLDGAGAASLAAVLVHLAGGRRKEPI